MKCPFCGELDTQVVDSRTNEEGNSVRRRRRCGACDKRFTTHEVANLNIPNVVKTNGIREKFSRDKLRTSFERALHKRPVPTEYIDRAIQDILQTLLSRGEREVASRELGERVMQELRKLDKVAYIRFASIYRSFQDVDDFHEAILDLHSSVSH